MEMRQKVLQSFMIETTVWGRRVKKSGTEILKLQGPDNLHLFDLIMYFWYKANVFSILLWKGKEKCQIRIMLLSKFVAVVGRLKSGRARMVTGLTWADDSLGLIALFTLDQDGLV